MKNKKILYYVLLLIVIFFALLYFFSIEDQAEQKKTDATSLIEINSETNQKQNAQLIQNINEINNKESLLARELNGVVVLNEEPVTVNEVKENVNETIAQVTEPVPTSDMTIGISSEQLETIVLENKSTGAQSGSGIDEEEKEIWTEIWNLRDASPIETDSFQVSFNYDSRLFDVVLKSDNSREQFYSWLTANGYQNIPASYFVYIVK